MKDPSLRWLEIAESDYQSSLYLLKGAHYPQAIYFLCQALEKLLKSAQVELTGKPPKKIHRLENIAHISGLVFSEKQYDVLTDLSKHYSRVRYPDISQISYNTKSKVESIITKGKELYLWIQNELKNQ